MNGDRRRIGTNFLIIGIILFLIGMFDYYISDLIHDFNSDIRIISWGRILQLVGGLLAIYGFMIHLEEYLATTRPPPLPGMPQPPPSSLLFLMDKETKKVVWVLMIAALIVYVISPGFYCQTILVILLVMVIIFLIMRREQWPYFPHPPPHYPPPTQMPYQPPSVKPSPPTEVSKVKLCEHCYAQLELDWVVCPLCGKSISPKSGDKSN